MLPYVSCAAATSSCRMDGSRVLPRPCHPLRPPCHSLQDNNLDDEAKQALKEAAGSGVRITFLTDSPTLYRLPSA